MKTYRVAKITTRDGVYFSARSDDRSSEEIVKAGVGQYEFNVRNNIPTGKDIYSSLYKHRNCQVETIFDGLTKAEANSKKKTLMEYEKKMGAMVLQAPWYNR